MLYYWWHIGFADAVVYSNIVCIHDMQISTKLFDRVAGLHQVVFLLISLVIKMYLNCCVSTQMATIIIIILMIIIIILIINNNNNSNNNDNNNKQSFTVGTNHIQCSGTGRFQKTTTKTIT